MNNKTNWTQQEEDYLRAEYSKIGPTKASKFLNRSFSSTRKKAGKMGLRFQREKRTDFIGMKRGRLIALKWASGEPLDSKRSRDILCQCDCGNTKIMDLDNFLGNKTNISCGCSRFGKFGNKNAGWSGVGELSGKLYSSMKGSAKERGLVFDVSKEYLWDLYVSQNRRCALSGLEITFPIHQEGSSKTVSLDRIDSSKGYILGNLQWVHVEVNYMKQDYTDEYFIKMCQTVTQYNL